MPFIILQAIGVLICVVFPPIITYLPSVIYQLMRAGTNHPLLIRYGGKQAIPIFLTSSPAILQVAFNNGPAAQMEKTQ